MIGEAPPSFLGKRWINAQGSAAPAPDDDLTQRLATELRIPPLIARLLITRGYTDAPSSLRFLEPQFKQLHPPHLLPGIANAADRIAHAVRSREKITLYGDYDVDGITGTAMLWHILTAAGASVETYIPHRVDEGYGLNVEAVNALIDSGTQLLVTIDCGCSALEPVAAARARGIAIIITDHHEFRGDNQLPPATAIVHPRLPQAPANDGQPAAPPYPNPDLCGAGVAFKLAWALAQKLCNAERVNDVYRALLMECCALAALGTIADVVPIGGGSEGDGENRILVKFGLQQLARTRLPGLRALIRAAGYGFGPEDTDLNRPLDCTAVGFALAPRLNAAGRMDHARDAVELLTAADEDRALQIAASLESLNRNRQSTERKMLTLAREQLAAANWQMATPFVLVIAHESFHAGVVGIVASRIVDAFHRPTFVLAKKGDELHGSARSIPGFELHLAIDHVRDLLTTGGGHAMAGGVKLAAPHLDAFRERLNRYAGDLLAPDDFAPLLHIDGPITLPDCRPAVIRHLERLAPFGRGNSRPRFLLENVRITAPPRRVGATGSHLQLTISSGTAVARCIAFKMGEWEPRLPVGAEIHLVVETKLSAWNGTPRVELIVQDIAPA